MKAAVSNRCGPSEVVRITDVEKPVPNDSEVLIEFRGAIPNS
jgi:NADPH:quinone reductase-like Zn-dependent oxidoreductase